MGGEKIMRGFEKKAVFSVLVILGVLLFVCPVLFGQSPGADEASLMERVQQSVRDAYRSGSVGLYVFVFLGGPR